MSPVKGERRPEWAERRHPTAYFRLRLALLLGCSLMLMATMLQASLKLRGLHCRCDMDFPAGDTDGVAAAVGRFIPAQAPAGAASSGSWSSSSASQGAWPRPPGGGEPPPKGDDEAYVALCLAVKDEHCDIREWVLYHASIGVGKFYLFDTQSEQPMEPVLEDLIASGLVQYHYVTNTSAELELEPPPPGKGLNWQMPVYKHCVRQFGAKHRWMGFIDADEYVVLHSMPKHPNLKTLPELLSLFEDQAGLGLHWRMFSSSGHMERPAGGILSSYTACWPQQSGVHHHVKSFVQPGLVEHPIDPHSWAYNAGWKAVNTGGVALGGAFLSSSRVAYKGAVLHHYVTRSLVDFSWKMERGSGAGGQKTLGNFLTYQRGGVETCTGAVALGQALERRFDLWKNAPPRCFGPRAEQAAEAAAMQAARAARAAAAAAAGPQAAGEPAAGSAAVGSEAAGAAAAGAPEALGAAGPAAAGAGERRAARRLA